MKGFKKKHHERVDISRQIWVRWWCATESFQEIQCPYRHVDKSKTHDITLREAKTCRGEFHGIFTMLLHHCFAGFLNFVQDWWQFENQTPPSSRKVAWNSFEHHLPVASDNFPKKRSRWFVGCLKYGIPRWWWASIPCCQAFLFVWEFHSEGEGSANASVNLVDFCCQVV